MESDSMYAIGRGHQVCEDYASSGKDFAVLSDGCSSSQDTDLGARYLVSASASYFHLHGSSGFAPRWVITRASQAASWLGSTPSCLDATLLVAHRKDNSILLTAAGDGVLAIRHTSGALTTFHIDDGGAPAYLSYLLDGARRSAYAAAGYAERVVTVFRDHVVVARVPLQFSTQFVLRLHLDTQGIEAVFLFSDGVSSFTTGGEPVPEQEVIAELCAIKGYRGEFVRRRMGRFLGKTCEQRGWHHHDDLAMAALYVGGQL